MQKLVQKKKVSIKDKGLRSYLVSIPMIQFYFPTMEYREVPAEQM